MRVVVAGAGFAGLLAAYRVAEAGHEVVVLEARDRVGGRVWSQELVPGDPRTVVERGAEFVLDGYDLMRTLAGEFGLQFAEMAMSYCEREPRGGAPTTHQEMARCAEVVAGAAASARPGTSLAEALRDQSESVGAQAEGVSRRIEEHPEGCAWLMLVLGRAEVEHRRLGSVEVVDDHVEMHLLRHLLSRPSWRDIPLHLLEGDALTVVRADLSPAG